MAPAHPAYADPKIFNRWRPKIHVIASQGWMNDPCAPLYDSTTGTYHIAFQWNPDACEWGNISWGAAFSTDLVNWKVSTVKSIAPSANTDMCGVFTGASSPVNIPRGGEGSQDYITCFYTSAQAANIHYTKPYKKGSEALHAATSINGGLTWQRHPENPILPGAPEHLAVTGWRDPYVFRWPRLDITRNLRPGSSLYGIISGGIRSASPTIFLYTINEIDPSQWKFLGTLLEPGLNFSPTVLGGDFGVNWEVANIVTLQDQDREEFDVLIVGVEGCRVANDRDSRSVGTRASRAGRSQRWLCGNTCQSSTGLVTSMVHRFSGVLDWGALYAANSFYDPISNRQVVFGWILEDDLNDELRQTQGWAGFLSLPRSLSMQAIERVEASCIYALEKLPGFTYRNDGHGLLKVSTICCEPHPQVQTLRGKETFTHDSLVLMSSLDSHPVSSTRLKLPGMASLELNSSFSFDKGYHALGIDIWHSPGKKHWHKLMAAPG
ncbi:Arabinanase/levansucrase/invertase [Aureobasidium pullulans]|uniref:Arabinanase/levansucrase/invertase n=1 Tax=Aureobasidium pullulans TaxID=5580 RepID=A0A4T0BTJ2_AURPU|nr:Arabinanase/levansucrase/invertase [Aureobasidium pullulans]